MIDAAARYFASDDFRAVVWAGQAFTLTRSQAAILRVLMAAACRGIRELPQGELTADLDCFRVADVFRDRVAGKLRRSPALGVVVVRGSRRGLYRLGIPAEDFSEFRKSLTVSPPSVLYDSTQPEEFTPMFADAFPTITHDPPPIASTARMAARLGVTQKVLKGWAERGLVPSIPAGGKRLFNIRATEEAVARLAAGENPDPSNPPPRAA